MLDLPFWTHLCFSGCTMTSAILTFCTTLSWRRSWRRSPWASFFLKRPTQQNRFTSKTESSYTRLPISPWSPSTVPTSPSRRWTWVTSSFCPMPIIQIVQQHHHDYHHLNYHLHYNHPGWSRLDPTCYSNSSGAFCWQVNLKKERKWNLLIERSIFRLGQNIRVKLEFQVVEYI